MKPLLIFVMLLLISCQGTSSQMLSDSTFAFQFNAKTFVEIQCENCEGRYGIGYRSPLQHGWAKFSFKKTKIGVYFSEAFVDFPQQARLVANEPQRNYISMITLMPNDTLKLEVAYDSTKRKHHLVKIISSKYPELTQYSIDKVKDLGYYETDFTLVAVEQDKREDFLRAEIRYVEEYHKKKPLPLWFVNMEKNNSLYYFEDTWTSDKPVENRHALNSIYYMMFLDQYVKLKAGLLDSAAIKKAQETGICLAFLTDELTTDLIKRSKFADKNFSSVVSDYYKLYLLYRITNLSPTKEQMDLLFDSMKINTAQIKDFARTKIKNYANAISYQTEEKELPEFLVLNEKSELIVLNEHLKNTTYLSFWFPACSPCIKAVPDKNKLVENMPSDSFNLINICVAGSEEEWKKAIEKYKMKGKHFYVKHAEVEMLMKNLFTISSFPHYSLIQDGKLVVRIAEKPDAIQKYIESLQKK